MPKLWQVIQRTIAPVTYLLVRILQNASTTEDFYLDNDILYILYVEQPHNRPRADIPNPQKVNFKVGISTSINYIPDKTKSTEFKMTEETISLINTALKKIDSTKEKDLCKYLPETSGKWQMHHFSLKKMKEQNPGQFKQLIKEFILDAPTLRRLDSKPRAPHQRNKTLTMQFSRSMLKKIAQMAAEKGEKELLEQIRPNLSLTSLKKEFMDSIRKNEIDESLWEAYKDGVVHEEKREKVLVS